MKIEEYYGDITGFSGDAIIVFHVEDSGRFFRTTQRIDRSLDGALKELAGKEGLSLNALITQIDEQRSTGNLSSALRLYVLKTLQGRI